MKIKYENAAAPESLKGMTLGALLDAWNEIEKKPMSEELPTVRGWLMDELNARNPAAFDAWMDNEDYTDEWKSNPLRYFTPAYELYNVRVTLPDGRQDTFWEVTLDEAYRRAKELGVKNSTFTPIISARTIEPGRLFALDLSTQAVGATLCCGEYDAILRTNNRFIHMTVSEILKVAS